MTEEVRVIDPDTGGVKCAKLAKFGLVPPDALWAVAEHFGRGAQKYTDNNWLLGYKWSLSFDALMRHAWAFWAGEDKDPETGSCHMTAVAWHALCLLTYWLRGIGKDDRYKAS